MLAPGRQEMSPVNSTHSVPSSRPSPSSTAARTFSRAAICSQRAAVGRKPGPLGGTTSLPWALLLASAASCPGLLAQV